MMKRAAVFLLAFLSACSFAPQETGAGFMFALEPVSVGKQGAKTEALTVAIPATSPELDSARIALKLGQRWDYYAGARWSQFLPSLVQDRFVKTLDAAGLFKSVAGDETGLTGDKILKTDIRAFEADYAPGALAPVVKIRINASLVTRLERRPLAAFTFAAEERAAGKELADIQKAFARAFSRVEEQLVDKMAEALK